MNHNFKSSLASKAFSLPPVAKVAILFFAVTNFELDFSQDTFRFISYSNSHIYVFPLIEFKHN